jgi:hypothetical protein
MDQRISELLILRSLFRGNHLHEGLSRYPEYANPAIGTRWAAWKSFQQMSPLLLISILIVEWKFAKIRKIKWHYSV